MKKSTLFFLCFIFLSGHTFAQYRIETDPKTGKKGLINQGKTTIPFEYDDLRIVPARPGERGPGDSLIMAEKGSLKGAFHASGRVLVPLEYLETRLAWPDVPFMKGYVAVSMEPKYKNEWGLFKLGGDLVLPMEYEFVTALFPDLLVARKARDPLLYFFDGAGGPLFTVTGHSAAPGFNRSSVRITRYDDSSIYFIDKKGNPVFSDRWIDPQWTDGKRVICGKQGKMGLLTIQFDTILPCRYHEIRAYDANHFHVSSDTRQYGLADSTGRFFIPLGDHSITRIGYDSTGAFLLKGKKDFTDQIFDREGKKLVSDCRFLQADMELIWRGRLPDQQVNNYFTVKLADRQKVGFFRNDGRMIVPPQYGAVLYCSERHPLIVSELDLPPNKKGKFLAYDLAGALLLPPRYTHLSFTHRPDLLYGRSDNNQYWGFIDPLHPETAKFEYERMIQLDAFYFAVKKGNNYLLLDPDGKKVAEGVFSYMGSPQRKHLQQFEKEGSGKLVAIARRPEAPKSDWIGFNEQGGSFSFQEPPEEPVTMEEVGLIGDAFIIQPVFPGGEKALMKFIGENLRYPPQASAAKIEGRVIATFFVETDGSINDVQVLRDIGAGCGEETVRLLKSMPKWTPGQQFGKPARMQFTLPVVFKL